MRRGLKWLIFASAVVGVITVIFLLLIFVPDLEAGLKPQWPWMWDRTRFVNPWSFLATVTIALLMLAIPLSHIAWLVLAGIWLAHSSMKGSEAAPSNMEGSTSDTFQYGGKRRRHLPI